MPREEYSDLPIYKSRTDLRNDLAIDQQLKRLVPTFALEFNLSVSEEAQAGSEIEDQYTLILSNLDDDYRAVQVEDGKYLISAFYQDRLVSQRLYDAQSAKFTWFADIFYTDIKDVTSGDDVLTAIEFRRGFVEGRWEATESLYKLQLANHSLPSEADERDILAQFLYQQIENTRLVLAEINISYPVGDDGKWVQSRRQWEYKNGKLTNQIMLFESVKDKVKLSFERHFNQGNGERLAVRRIHKSGEDMQWLLKFQTENINISLNPLLTLTGDPTWPNDLGLEGKLDLSDKNKPKVFYQSMWRDAKKTMGGLYFTIHNGISDDRIEARLDEEDNITLFIKEEDGFSLN